MYRLYRLYRLYRCIDIIFAKIINYYYCNSNTALITERVLKGFLLIGCGRNFFVRVREIIVSKFEIIDSGLFVVENNSLYYEGRMAFRSFSKTVRHRQESAVSAM